VGISVRPSAPRVVDVQLAETNTVAAFGGEGMGLQAVTGSVNGRGGRDTQRTGLEHNLEATEEWRREVWFAMSGKVRVN
jgi:hypothetical protein